MGMLLKTAARGVVKEVTIAKRQALGKLDRSLRGGELCGLLNGEGVGKGTSQKIW